MPVKLAERKAEEWLVTGSEGKRGVLDQHGRVHPREHYSIQSTLFVAVRRRKHSRILATCDRRAQLHWSINTQEFRLPRAAAMLPRMNKQGLTRECEKLSDLRFLIFGPYHERTFAFQN